MGELDRLNEFLKARKRRPDPEQDDDPMRSQQDNYDSDAHPGAMFLADLEQKKVFVDVPKKVDPKKLGLDIIGHIVLTGMDDERLESLRNILKRSPGKVPVYMTQELSRKLQGDLDMGDFDKVDEHIVKENRDFDVNGVNITLTKVKGSNELKLILHSGEEYHQGNWISKSNRREQLASMIHDEWISWSKSVADKVTPEKRAKWEKLWIPYDKLTETQKDKDRVWADKALKVMGLFNKGEESLSEILTLIKTRGVATRPGPAPGPPPRPGLKWKPETHRWTADDDDDDRDPFKDATIINIPAESTVSQDELIKRVHSIEADFASKFATAEVEHCVAVDADGKPIFSKKGTKESIFFSDKEAEKIFGAYEFVHNHPFGGGSFSLEDLLTQWKLRIHNMVVVNGDQKFTIELPSMNITQLKMMASVFEIYRINSMSKHMTLCLNKYDRIIAAAERKGVVYSKKEDQQLKEKIMAEIWLDQTDEMWRHLSREFGFKYTRETIDVPLKESDDLIELGSRFGKGILLDDSEMWVPDEYRKTLDAGKVIMKAQGIPETYGPPPGPPPRPGLEWKPETHRWIRPGEEHTDETSVMSFEKERSDMDEALSGLKTQKVDLSELSDKWDADSVSALKDNADSYLGQYEKFFDATTYNKARSAAYAIINAARGAKVSASPEDIQVLVQDSIDKLVYQEMRAWERQVSDHGIRHIVGNITVQDRISKALISGGVKISPQQRFMMTIVMINHDMGYTMADARLTIEGTKKHKQYSREYFDHERNFFNKYFNDDELDTMSDLILHHDDTTVDWDNDPVGTTVCVTDNLSLFHEDKLPSLYRYVDGALDSLYDMQKGLQANDPEAVNKAKAQLYDSINGSNLPEYSKSWLRQAANEVTKYTAKYTIPMLIGNIDGFSFEDSKGLEISINEDPFDEKVGDLIDMGQTQYAKFAKDYGVDLKDNDNVEFQRGGKTLLSLKIKRHQMEKMMYGLYAIDMILKAGKTGLIPKKVMVHRGTQAFMQTVYVKPGAEGGDIYKRFLDLDYNKFFGKRAKATTEAIEAVSKEIESQRLASMGEQNHYRAVQLLADWVEGVLPRIISIRMIASKMHGKEFTMEQTEAYVKSLIPGADANTVKTAYSIAYAMSLYFDESHPEPSMDFFADILKEEKKFAVAKARDLFGDKIVVYRGVYGPQVTEIKKALKDKGHIELEEFPYTSYTQDYSAAYAFVYQKKDYLVFKQEIPVEDVASAWFSNPMMTVSMPEQKECIIDRENQIVILKPEDIVDQSD